MENPNLDAIISNLHDAKAYRPVGVFVLYDSRERFLITQSAFNPNYWGFPQGGIDPPESLQQNFYRELIEELGVYKTDLEEEVFGFYVETKDAEHSRKDKRGFTHGKAYIFSMAKYIGKDSFTPNRKEIADARLVSMDDAKSFFLRGREEKAELSIRILELSARKIGIR